MNIPMSSGRGKWVVLAVIIFAVGAASGYWFGHLRPAGDTTATTPAAAKGEQTGRKVLYWHDPMVPSMKFDKPGKSPFMDMELVPVYADEESAGGDGRM